MNAPEELDELEQALLDCLDKHGRQTAPALAQRCKLGGQLATVKRALSRMQRLGLVEIERSGHAPRWQVCAAEAEPEPAAEPAAAEARFAALVRTALTPT